ncbi:transporter substrate-binding domain-containing protein [Paucibacter sp. TC2R-5]|uniref:substrate-binding periplasmic protein n=1 Tax=Paucibacter sp. TC2R-5 TaxID=2893555 RepID=UPI0021E3A9C7|nr:transporter substrate-binding domain-containing protein [Paucibacter sp. TC2R-5]MCV2360083.1 transporter substrate-binding domain-containing protein [Paucibacter sp. TC2R-5]
MRLPALLLSFAMLTCATARAQDSAPVILCLTEFPPFNSEQLPKQGPLIELATEAFKRAGRRIDAQFMPWARALKEAEGGRCALFGIWRNAARDQVFDYSKPIIQMELGFFGRRGVALDFNDPRVLAGLLIGIQRATYLPPLLDNKNLRFDLGNDLLSSMRKLVRERVDLAYGNRALGQHLLASDPDLGAAVEWKSPALEVKDHLLGFAKSYEGGGALLKGFNKGLDSMKADGSYRKILSAGGLDVAR